MNESDYILLHERSEDDDMINITNQDDTSTSITSSRLKPPTSRKVLRRVLAERAEEIIRQPVEDKPVEDKNIQYLRKMAEKKRLEKEKSQQNQLKAEKLRLKLKQSVLKRAAIVKAKEQLAKQQVETRIELKSLTDEEIQSKNEKARQAKRLREKQQQYLEKLANENQKKEREEASKEALETLRKNKREAALRDVKSKVFDEPVGSGVAAVRQIRKVVGAVPECSNEVQVKKSTTAALRKKQEEYLLLLQEKKKEEMDKENERQSRLDKIQIKAREAAHANHLQAKEQLLEKKKQLRDSTPVVVVKPKVQVDVDAMVTRLTKTSEKNVQSVPEARDFDSWKKRQGITDPGTKVFSITGWYPVIKAALEERGWVYNPDRESPFFDLKWTLKSDDLKSIKLNDSQYVNHFMQNTAITTKVGLLKNLKSLQWFESVDIDTFFPRAYDLNDETDMQVFTDDYKAVVAERLLKQLLVNTSCDVNTGVLDVVLSVCLKRQQILTDEQLDSTDVLGVEELVTDLQWKVLTQCDLLSSYDSELEIDDIRPQKPEFSTDTSIVEKKRLKKLYKARQKALETEKHRLDLLLRQIEPLSETVKTRITTVAQGLQQNCPQYDLNGAEPKNVWIVKPAGMSRGRGIRVFDDLSNLLAYTDVENHKESQWVVQKYIENPLLLSGRKFDIRQWVLVTNWNPLTVWFYDDCYLRFCVEEYSLDDLNDQFIHLANNSISKHSEKFHQVYSTDGEQFKVEGNMWHSDDFKAYLNKKVGASDDIWKHKIQSRMKTIVASSLQCVQDMVTQRKNTCELYGYDFMLDENYDPWLIEVNSSPACDYSTTTAKRYVEDGLADIVKVIVDHREYESSKAKGPKPSTGKWSIIHKGTYLPKPLASFGADFEVKGSRLKRRHTMDSKPPLPRPEDDYDSTDDLL